MSCCLTNDDLVYWRMYHDDVIKWKHFRESDPLYGEFTGNRWIHLTKASDAELWCFLWSAPWINGWVDNREAGDLRCHRAHYDVIVMMHYSASMCWGSLPEPSLNFNSHLAGPWIQGIIAHQTPHFRRPPKHINNKGPSVFAQTSSKCTFRTKSFNGIWKYISFGIYV